MKYHLEILVTKRAMELISDPEKNADTKRAVQSAMEAAEGVDYTEPRTRMIEGCPLGVHVDPTRGVVIILAKFPGWPVVKDDLVKELIPLTTVVSLA